MKVTEHFFDYGGHKYFRVNAHLVELGTYGEKKDPLGVKAYIDPQNDIRREYLVDKVDRSQVHSIDWSQTNTTDIGLALKVFDLGAAAAISYEREKVRTAKLKLMSFSVKQGALKNILNHEADGARQYLANYGNDGRIVSEVWVVLSAELGEHIASSPGVLLAVADGDLKFTAKGGKHGTHTIQLSKGAVFAYRLHKVKRWKDNKTWIDELEDDYKGMG